MKEIKAYVRRCCVNKLVSALQDAGAPGITSRRRFEFEMAAPERLCCVVREPCSEKKGKCGKYRLKTRPDSLVSDSESGQEAQTMPAAVRPALAPVL